MDEITFVISETSQHQGPMFEAASLGLRQHGVKAVVSKDVPKTRATACWGWRRGRQLRAQGHEVLVFERAYLGDRFHWTSIAWNGLNARGNFMLPRSTTPDRFKQHFSPLAPWREAGDYIIIMGQVRGDMSLGGRDLTLFYLQQAKIMEKIHGKPVLFRKHPAAEHRNFRPGLPEHKGSLEEALASAHLVLTWNSNSAVDAVVAGVPALSFDQGSMAWDVTGHRSDHRLTPPRKAWAARLAHCQWTPEEIAAGAYWPRMRQFLTA